MNSKKTKLPKRLLATLLTICMFITMVPAGVFAVESQETVDETVVIQNDISEPTTEDEEDVSTSTGDSELSEETETDGSETDTPTEPNIPTADDEAGDVAGEYTITLDMTQEDVDAAVANATGPITVQAGDYGGENGAQILITLNKEQGQTVVLENTEEGADYQRLVIVVLTEGNVLEGNGATINGEVTTEDNQSPAIYIPYGSLTLKGELTLDNHDYGVILGHTNGTTNETAELILEAGTENSPGAVLNITNCRALKDRDTEKDSQHNDISFNNGQICGDTEYYSNLDTQGDGTRSSGITTRGNGNITVKVSPKATLNATGNQSWVWNSTENEYVLAGAGIYPITVQNFTLDIGEGSTVNLTENGQGLCMNTDYAKTVNVKIDNATFNVSDNLNNGITGQTPNADNSAIVKDYSYQMLIEGNPSVTINDNGAIGVNNFYVTVKGNSEQDKVSLSVSDNSSHGMTNVAFDAEYLDAKFNDNSYVGLNVTLYNSEENITTIANSTIQANGNGGPGLRFLVNGGVGTVINNSNVIANNNGTAEDVYGWEKGGENQPSYWAGIVGAEKVKLENSVVISDSVGGYGHYNRTNHPATLYIDGTDIVAVDSDKITSNQDIADDWNTSGYTGRTHVMGGSLQADYDQMRREYSVSEINSLIPIVDGTTGNNQEKVLYTAPINNNRTALTRFDLNNEVDKGTSLLTNSVEEGATQTYSFKVWDPNNDDEMTENYTYTFRYNETGEDLSGEDVSGNAYVWTPVTMIRYDATEGTIDSENLGTAQTKTDNEWSLVNNRGDDSTLNYNVEETYIDAVDYTICGNSLALSEGTPPTATKENQSFAGWYYVVGEEDIEQAADLAEEAAEDNNYSALYNFLLENGKKFDANTLTSDDGAEVDEITLYAVWTDTITITPANLSIYMGGDDGYDAVVDDDGDIDVDVNNSLPHPIFKLAASDGYTDLDGMTFTTAPDSEGKVKTWTAERIDKTDGTPSEYYSLEPAEGQDEVRVTYTDANGQEHLSDDFDIGSVKDLFTTFTVKLYTNQVDVSGITATINNNGSNKHYSVDASGTGTLTVRAVENTVNNAAVSPVTTEEPTSRLEAGTGLIVVDEGTTYTVNNLGIPMPEGQAPSLLFDAIVTSDGVDREAALENKVAEQVSTPNNRTRRYQSQYLDLVDADNGNIWLTASNEITVYWAYPTGTDASDDFTLWHFEGLHRDDSTGGQSGFDIDDINADTTKLENVDIDKGQYGISFTVEPGGFSPFVLTWTEGSGQPIDPGTDPDDPDTPALDKVNHFLYIEGYPEDYRTGEYSDNEDLWPVKPQGNITRAEVATIFYRLLKDEVREEIETDVNSFPDVNADDWFNVTVSSLANMGAISGYEDGTFRPNESITRAELASMAVRFYDAFEAEYEEGTFLDVDGDEWYADAIAAAEELGILGGYPDGTVRPNNNITRAETCAIVNRVLERRPHDEHLGDVDEMRTWPDNLPGAWYYADMQEATNGHYYEWIDIDGVNFEEWTEVDKDYDWTKR